MAKFEFVATHGVEMGVPAWAKFERDRDLDTPDGEKRYKFATDDAAVADRLRKVDDFGIVEVSAPPRRGRPPASE